MLKPELDQPVKIIILKKILLELISKVKSSTWEYKNSYFYQWDGASSHTSKKTIKLIEKFIPRDRWIGKVHHSYKNKSEVLQWPPRSCDLTPLGKLQKLHLITFGAFFEKKKSLYYFRSVENRLHVRAHPNFFHTVLRG